MTDDRDLNPLDDEESGDWQFLGRVDMDDDGQFQADVFQNQDAPEPEDFHLNIDDLLGLMGLELNDQDILLDVLTQRSDNIEALGFDFSNPNGRGGYEHDEVIRFLNDTGWWGIVDIYYDEDYEEYFIELPDDSGQLKTP